MQSLRFLVGVCALGVASLLTAPGIFAQAVNAPPPSYALAEASLTARDTAAAIAHLRRAIVEDRRYGPAHLLLGSLLTAQSGEFERGFSVRMEAQEHLLTAFRLLGSDPEVLAEYGLLQRQRGITVDARRTLERALDEAERTGYDFGHERLANIHYTLALLYEVRWSTPEGERVRSNSAFEVESACLNMPPGGGMANSALYCPVQFWRALPLLTYITHYRHEERDRMLAHFRAALHYDPAHAAAAVRLLSHLADAEAWQEYEQVASQLTWVLPADPMGYLWLGIRMHGRGRAAAADSLFSRALALMEPEDRQPYLDIEPLLTPRAAREYGEADDEKRAEMERIFFTAKDPLYLTGVNERRLEHLARVAWVELRFALPRRDLRGHETEHGDIWIRYGTPARRINNIWSYGERGPNFVFTGIRHVEQSKLIEEGLRRVMPETYQPATVTEILALPHQTAVFRGREHGRQVLEVYGLVDASELRAPADSVPAAEPEPDADELEAGLFLFDELYAPLWHDRSRLRSAADGRALLTYRVDVVPGSYRYGLEARVAGPDSVPRPAARARHEIEVPDLWTPALAVSELLLAESIEPSVPEPRQRSDLTIVPRRFVQVDALEALDFYFEIYGLEAAADGSTRFEVELAIENASQRNVAQRALRGLQRLAGRLPEDPRLRWERIAESVDDTVVEFLSVELTDPQPGEYLMRVTVTDLATGARAERTRWLQLMP